jgi:uncharacterized protein (UPF0276 family)
MVDLGEIKNQSNTSLETDTDVYNPSITLPPPTAPGALTIVAGTVQGMTRENVSNPLHLSEPAFNMTSPADQINNTSMLARMWRNAHAEHLMDMAYVGDASYPSWIAPVSPIKLLQRYDLGKINRYSLNMTRPGENIIPAF